MTTHAPTDLAARAPALTFEELRADVDRDAIDTVLLVLADMQGRLQGKRLGARHFVQDVASHGAEGCCYLLAVDVEMNTVDGYGMASWDTGYGDFELHPDLTSLRRVPWHPGTALCMADLVWSDGRDVAASPRQILRRQLDRLAQRGWEAHASTELEFIVFRDSYEEAWSRGYRDLTPANLYNVDYSMLGTARVEPLMRRIRREMSGAGMVVESSKGECNFGQHEVNFRYAPALQTADNHVIYKDGAKTIAAQEGLSITYMPKFDAREGNSCHIHLSIRGADGTPVMAQDDGLFGGFVAGQLAHMRELMLFYASTINAYKRYAAGSFAPTAIAWGPDNRTCAVRVVGEGAGLRLESRVPGGDVNPYLALSAMIASGLAGIDAGLTLEAPLTGSGYEAVDKPHVPRTLREARELFASSELARSAFGEDVVGHYLNMAQVELDAFDAAVTDWERYRGFERL